MIRYNMLSEKKREREANLEVLCAIEVDVIVEKVFEHSEMCNNSLVCFTHSRHINTH